MEAMDYNYFASAQQPYQYMGYGDAGLLSSTGEVIGATPSMEGLNSGSFSLSNFDYQFDTSLGQGLTPLPTASVSPPPQHLSIRPNGSVDSGIAVDMEHEGHGRRGSSEEKDSLTPAQSRRKAQNRAAQRAFRERKERHVRDLEAKLNLLTTTTSSLQSDNERLKLMLQRAQTENEILRATASSSPTSHHPPSFVDDPSLLPSHRPSKGSPKPHLDAARLAYGLLSSDSTSPRYGSSPGSDSNLLSASATWDLLQSHPLYLSGAVDIGEVCERLKKMARCDGMGPMFGEDEVRQVIEEVGRSGSDELI
ncbi:Fluconazole resistance protein 3 [Fulvia fulva]|nr:Fluconazole resistance protein 3 [Fulvia fulva]WPV37864.1 Fluconazole resistance protein 3 [Fulvia fulva]